MDAEQSAAGRTNVSVSLPIDVIETIRARTGKRGFSQYVLNAVTHRIRMDNLGELVEDFERRNDPITDAERSAAREELFGDAEARTDAA
jgi:hypothetical protein